MNSHLSRAAILALTLAAAYTIAAAQESSSNPPHKVKKLTPAQIAAQMAAQPAQQPAPDETQKPLGTVIFSRSADDTTAPASEKPVPQSAATADADRVARIAAAAKANPTRQAEHIENLKLDLRLEPGTQHIAARADLKIKNTGATPLAELRLQISSTLHWESAQIAAAPAQTKFSEQRIDSDINHTGALSEIILPLATPLAPGATIALDLRYSGIIPQAAERLTAIGTPDDRALASDWDRISADFTGLRGFGNVAWYPVIASPVFLGEGAKLFTALSDHRRSIEGSHFTLDLTVVYPFDSKPTIALFNGRELELRHTSVNSNDHIESIARGYFESTLGFDEPSLFLATRTLTDTTPLRIWSIDSDPAKLSAQLETWTLAAQDVSPFVAKWLGQSKAQLTVLELPDASDQPYESGSLLVAPLGTGTGIARINALDHVLAHGLTHATLDARDQYFFTRPLWLSEGLANFIDSLWVEKQNGRDSALRQLDSGRAALALAEPESPGASDGSPIARAIEPDYTHTKATYIFWMLRDIIGDGNLQQLLARQLKGKTPDEVEASFEAQLRSAVADHDTKNQNDIAAHDLEWFIHDWLQNDKGLPDLAINGVYSHTSATPGSWLAAVDIANSGYTQAEVKFTVKSATNNVVQRVLVPARGKVTPQVLIVGKPTEADLNDGTVPETQATIHVKTIE